MDVDVGAKLRVRVKSRLRLPLVLRPTVTVCEANRELRWRGHVVTPWLGAGDHTFTVEPTRDGRVRFVQREVFTGLLPSLFRQLVARETRAGFQAMNDALKVRAETEARARDPENAKSARGPRTASN